MTSIWQGAVIVCALEICLRAGASDFGGTSVCDLGRGFWYCGGTALGGRCFISERAPQRVLLMPARRGVRRDRCCSWMRGGVWRLRGSGWRLRRFVAASLAVHSMRLRRLWKAARPVEVSATLAAALGDVRGGRVTICTTEMLDRPSVIGFLAPRILIPAWLMARLTPGELEQIVLHEAEHLRRRDDWTNLAQKLALVAFPLNPALAWMEHRLCREREMACDEGVVRITKAPRAYAACLASLAERGLERRAEALSLGAWHRRSELVHRVHGILLRKRGLSKAAAGALLGAVGCALVAGSVEMARCPQLVAFVPEQKSLAMTPERQQEMAAMLARENAEAKMSLPAGFHAVQAKAVMPPLRPASEHDPSIEAQKSEAAVAVKAAAKDDAQQIAKADVAGDRVNPSRRAAMGCAGGVGGSADCEPHIEHISDYDASAATTTLRAMELRRHGKKMTEQRGRRRQATKTSPNSGEQPVHGYAADSESGARKFEFQFYSAGDGIGSRRLVRDSTVSSTSNLKVRDKHVCNN